MGGMLGGMACAALARPVPNRQIVVVESPATPGLPVGMPGGLPPRPARQRTIEQSPWPSLAVSAIEIRGTNTVDGVTFYEVLVGTASGTHVVMRRYSSFDEFRKKLRAFFRGSHVTFPKKTFFKVRAAAKIEARRLMLDAWLRHVVVVASSRSTWVPALHKFLDMTPSGAPIGQLQSLPPAPPPPAAPAPPAPGSAPAAPADGPRTVHIAVPPGTAPGTMLEFTDPFTGVTRYVEVPPNAQNLEVTL